MCCGPLGERLSILQHMMTTRTPEQAAAAAPGAHAGKDMDWLLKVLSLLVFTDKLGKEGIN